MRTKLLRLAAAAALAVLVGGAFTGCDDSNVEITGIGASVGLPGSTMTGSGEIGVGNVHWVGNPRW